MHSESDLRILVASSTETGESDHPFSTLYHSTPTFAQAPSVDTDMRPDPTEDMGPSGPTGSAEGGGRNGNNFIRCFRRRGNHYARNCNSNQGRNPRAAMLEKEQVSDGEIDQLAEHTADGGQQLTHVDGGEGDGFWAYGNPLLDQESVFFEYSL